MSPAVFCEARIQALDEYAAGRNSFWIALGSGRVEGGKIGAVRVRDQYGAEGLIVQQYVGASTGCTRGLSGYQEQL